MRAGADMHALADWGQTPIFYAAAEGRLRAVQELCRLAFTRYLPRINSDLKLMKPIQLELGSVSLPEGDST